MANGRVNLLEHTNDIFTLYDKIPVNQKATSYTDALTGNWTDSPLSIAFFSKENVQINQDAIRATVHKKTNKVIAEQNEDILKVIMRSIFLQYSANDSTNITQQIIALNKQVTNFAVPKIIGELIGYLNYKKDVSTMHVPMELPHAFSVKGSKVAKQPPFF